MRGTLGMWRIHQAAKAYLVMVNIVGKQQMNSLSMAHHSTDQTQEEHQRNQTCSFGLTADTRLRINVPRSVGDGPAVILLAAAPGTTSHVRCVVTAPNTHTKLDHRVCLFRWVEVKADCADSVLKLALHVPVAPITLLCHLIVILI